MRDYHEKKYEEKEPEVEAARSRKNSGGDRVEIAKDGLGLILQRSLRQ